MPTPTPTATPVPTPTPTPTARPTPTPTATPTPPAAQVATYHNDVFGFSLEYPKGWSIQDGEGGNPVVIISGPEQSPLPGAEASKVPEVRASVGYSTQEEPADVIADELQGQVVDFLGGRLVSESQTTLRDGTPAFQVTFAIGAPPQELRLAYQVVVRGTQYVLLQVFSPRDLYEQRIDEIQDTLQSLALEEPTPFGIPKKEALTLFLDDGPLTLDPALASEMQSVQYIYQVFSGLVTFGRDLKMVNDLAERWEVSGNGTIYTFTLRASARFHDGRSVTAQDVKYSWERAALPDTGSATVETYLEDIVGIKEVKAGRATEISGVEVVDERTLRVTIDAPKVYFLAKLAHPVAFVVDRQNVETGGAEWWRQPNGTGPFRIKGWKEGLVLALERNDAFYREPAQVRYVVFRLSGGLPVSMYKTGELDSAFVTVSEMELVEGQLLKEQTQVSELSVNFVGFNSAKPPFDDPKVRKAFLLAVNREQVVQNVYSGSATLAQGFLPPGLPGHSPELSPIPFDPTEARRLLSESSYGGPEKLPPIVFTVPGFLGPSRLEATLWDEWRTNLGLEVQFRLVEPARYYYQLDQEVKDLYPYGWIADYPDPHNFLDVLFHSGAKNNVGGYRNQAVDGLLEQARVEQDPQARLGLYQQAERLLVEDAAGIPLSFGQSSILVKPYVQGLVPSPQGLLDLRAVSLLPREQRA